MHEIWRTIEQRKRIESYGELDFGEGAQGGMRHYLSKELKDTQESVRH